EGLARVYHSDLWGTRDAKSEFLFSHGLWGLKCTELSLEAPHYMLVPWDYATDREFRRGFSLEDALPVHSNGIVTGSDSNFISGDVTTLRERFGEASEIEPLSYRLFERSFLLNNPSKLERDRS